jgi:hypothetical protein
VPSLSHRVARLPRNGTANSWMSFLLMVGGRIASMRFITSVGALALQFSFLQHLTQVVIDSCSLVEYHKTKNLPQNFIAIGDSVMRSSPVYGLGVAKACVGAVKLEGLLASTQGPEIPKISRRHFSNASILVLPGHGKLVTLMGRSQLNARGPSRNSSKDSDYLFPTTEPVPGEKLKVGAFASKLMAKFAEICTR